MLILVDDVAWSLRTQDIHTDIVGLQHALEFAHLGDVNGAVSFEPTQRLAFGVRAAGDGEPVRLFQVVPEPIHYGSVVVDFMRRENPSTFQRCGGLEKPLASSGIGIKLADYEAKMNDHAKCLIDLGGAHQKRSFHTPVAPAPPPPVFPLRRRATWARPIGVLALWRCLPPRCPAAVLRVHRLWFLRTT